MTNGGQWRTYDDGKERTTIELLISSWVHTAMPDIRIEVKVKHHEWSKL